jgi:hypothetical protein
VPIAVAVRSEAHIFVGCSNTGIVGSNPTRRIDMNLGVFCVLLSCVDRGIVGSIIVLSKESCQFSLRFVVSEAESEREEAQRFKG